MSMPTLLILFGTVLIAVGGILATYGWNARTEEVQKSAMVRSVAAELLMNISVINDPKFTETDENKLSQFVIFPRMQITALESAISSGFFLSERDRLFMTRVVGLHERLNGYNLRLSFTEFQMANNPRNITTFRTKVRDGVTRTQVISKLEIFAKLLLSDYGIKESDVFFVTLEEDAT